MTPLSQLSFDLDGTLVDSSIGIHNAFTLITELGCLTLMPNLFVVFMGPPLESNFATCLPKDQISEAVQICRSYYKAKRHP